MQKIQIIIAAIFWMYCSKNILFLLPLFKKRKSHKTLNFSYPGSGKVLTSTKIIISGKKCCRCLMQNRLKYLWAQFGYDWTKNKEMVGGREKRGEWTPVTYLTFKKLNHCRVKNAKSSQFCWHHQSCNHIY